jgi:DNA-binding CsgD family transcriptional regulator
MPAVPGTLIFDLSGRLLYYNSQAFSLLSKSKASLGKGGSPLNFPSELLDLYQKTRLRLEEDLQSGMKEVDQAVLDDPSNPITLRSFAVGNGVPPRDRIRILIMLEPSPREDGTDLGKTAAAFKLSPREVEVVQRILDGLTYPAIAEALYVSPETVKTHVKHIMRKLGVSTRSQIMAKLMGLQ